VDRAILGALCRTFAGHPVGLGTLAVSVGEEPDTLEDVYEPFLLKCGLLRRTPRGRVATAAAYEHLGLTPPDPAGPNLFEA
jgi:Holliday junction DNA helicase RuvB